MKEYGLHLDRLAKMTYVGIMQSQFSMESRTPTNTTFGSYGFSGNNEVAWRQILPRNPRRKNVILTAENFSFYLTNAPQTLDINTLVAIQENGQIDNLPVALFTFAAGMPLILDTTAPIYAASLTGNGSKVELTAVLNWVENIYADITASPLHALMNSTTKTEVESFHVDGGNRLFKREDIH
jgi:hypothetical protein